MRNRIPAFLLISSLLVLPACQDKNSRVAKFVKNQKAAVFVFLAPDCPLSQNYSPALNALDDQFQSKGVAFYGVFSGKAAEEKAANDFVRTYNLKLSALLDGDRSLAQFFGAAKTPEVFAADANGKIFYKGAIDNRAPELGQNRTVITEHYLFDAIDTFLQDRPVPVSETNAVGCFIE